MALMCDSSETACVVSEVRGAVTEQGCLWCGLRWCCRRNVVRLGGPAWT